MTEIERLKIQLDIAKKALDDINYWDESYEDKWKDPGERASYALDIINNMDNPDHISHHIKPVNF